MPGNTFGKAFQLTSWGESHGPAIGGVIDGIPPNIPLDIPSIQEALNKRRPGRNNFVTSRQENDDIEILSGLFEGKTLGTPVSFLIKNQDQRSQDYDDYKTIFRPGHADYTYFEKYGIRDHRGGGRASARETAVRVAAGAVARQVLAFLLPSPPLIQAAVIQIGPYPIDRSDWDWELVSTNPFFSPSAAIIPTWEAFLSDLKEKGLSAGALIEVQATQIPAGLGEPVYDKLDADLAKALMSINAVKGVEIGDGFSCISAQTGFDEITNTGFITNKAGGILGGISSGQDIVCRLAIKPTSSTKHPRQTITESGETVTLSINGRHDPCVGIRAVPIAEAMVALTLVDHLLRWHGQCGKENS